MFLPHFDVFCDLLLNRRTATWNLFVLYDTCYSGQGNGYQLQPSALADNPSHMRGRARGGGGWGETCHEVTIVNFRFHESRNKKVNSVKFTKVTEKI